MGRIAVCTSQATVKINRRPGFWREVEKGQIRLL